MSRPVTPSCESRAAPLQDALYGEPERLSGSPAPCRLPDGPKNALTQQQTRGNRPRGAGAFQRSSLPCGMTYLSYHCGASWSRSTPTNRAE